MYIPDIFTALEMDGDHFLAITSSEKVIGQVTDKSSTFFNTKPYGILNSEDRCEVCEGLLILDVFRGIMYLKKKKTFFFLLHLLFNQTLLVRYISIKL